jgi:hypothetical protein
MVKDKVIIPIGCRIFLEGPSIESTGLTHKDACFLNANPCVEVGDTTGKSGVRLMEIGHRHMGGDQAIIAATE